MIRTQAWSVIEFALESDRDRDNPYLDVVVAASFSGPDGLIIEREAFWDGGRTWRVRFAAPTPGEWRGSVSASDGHDNGLNRVLGEIAVETPQSERPGARQGFLRPSDKGRFLVDGEGRPFFWLGDTHWRFAWERWDEANKSGWTSQFRGTVDKRVAQGFTVYQTNLMGFGTGWDTSPCWEPGEPFRRIQPSYFADTVDPRMAYIAAAGLVNAFAIGWYQSVDKDPAGMARFSRYLVARYGALPLVWTLAGEVAGYDDPLRNARIASWRDVALTIQKYDAYHHPISAHLTNERPLADYYQDEDWLGVTLNQLGHGDLDMNPELYGSLLAQHPTRPLIEGESFYEGLTSVEPVERRTVTATMVRQVAYRAIQSGCSGYTYGAQGCWNNAWDKHDGATLWGELPWHEGVDLAGADQLGHLRQFYEAVKWWTLVPNRHVFKTSSGENARFYPPVVSGDDSLSRVVVYFGQTHRNDGQAELRGLPDGLFRLRWFHPESGRWRGEEHRTAVSNVLALPPQPKETDDWLLVVDLADI